MKTVIFNLVILISEGSEVTVPMRYEIQESQKEWLNPQKWVKWWADLSDETADGHSGYVYKVDLSTFHIHDEENRICQTIEDLAYV